MLEQFLSVLTRIAVALEKMVAVMPDTAPVSEPVKKASKKSTAKEEMAQAAPVNAPVVEVDPFSGETAAVPEVSIESVLAALKMHAVKFGNPVTLALMKKHGANQNTPTIKSIPTANYAACLAEIKSDLEKLQAKG